MVILGIDPGLFGALALLSDDGLVIHDMPILKANKGHNLNAYEVARIIDAAGHIDHAAIELVGPRPKDSRPGAFKFGYVCGETAGICKAHFIPITMVRPQDWKRDVRIAPVPKGLSDAKRRALVKDMARTRATELFPSHSNLFARKKDDGRAEAALIALWGRRSLAAREGAA